MTPLVQGLPALVMLVGAILGIVPLPIPVRFRGLLPVLTCVLAGVCLIILSRAPVGPITVFEPNDALPALSLTLQWNGIALPFGLFVLLVLSGRFLFGLETDTPTFVFGALIAAGGALLFFAADNWTTVALAWLVVELGMLTIPAEDGETYSAATRAFGWNLVGIVAWLTAGMVLSNQAASLRLEEISHSGTASFLILIAVWLRSGIYPFHVASPANLQTVGVRAGLPLLLGGYLMSRFLQQAQGTMAFGSEMQILALVAVGATALIVVGYIHGGEALTWMLRAMSAPLLLFPFFLGARVAPAASVWFGLGAFAAFVFVEIAMRWRAELPRVRLTLLVWVIALVMVAALPFAPMFWSRVSLVNAAYTQGGMALWLVLLATMSLLLVPAWREIFASREVAPKVPTRYEYAALACLLLPSLALSLLPFVFVAPFGASVLTGSTLAYDAIFRSQNFVALIFLLAGIFVPLLASFELARRWAPRANLVPTNVTNVLDLTRVGSILDGLYHFARTLVQQSLALLEQPPIAWLIFLAIWVAIWVIGLGA